MHFEIQQLMHQATMLTRAGNLAEATAAIQAAMRNDPPVARQQEDHDVIDVDAFEVREPTGMPGTAPMTDEEPGSLKGSTTTVGDTFVTGSFRNASGQRGYKLYSPPNADNRALPLVVMLHGCTQDPDDFAAGTAMNDAARAQGFYVLYPIQSTKVNPQKCWNWFKHNHQQKARGEPSIIAGMTREIIQTHPIDADRVYAAGLSAGGAMAAILASTHPDLYTAAGVHSGLAPGAATDLPSALAAMKGNAPQTPHRVGSAVPTIVFHGDRDATVHPDNARQVVAASAGSASTPITTKEPDTHGKRRSTKYVYRNLAGDVVAERWEIHGAGHAWAGGTNRGSYTDPSGPDATTEMLRFFFERTLSGGR